MLWHHRDRAKPEPIRCGASYPFHRFFRTPLKRAAITNRYSAMLCYLQATDVRCIGGAYNVLNGVRSRDVVGHRVLQLAALVKALTSPRDSQAVTGYGAHSIFWHYVELALVLRLLAALSQLLAIYFDTFRRFTRQWTSLMPRAMSDWAVQDAVGRSTRRCFILLSRSR
jgi:hypothetical protein